MKSRGNILVARAALYGLTAIALVVLFSTVRIALASAPAYLYVVNSLSEDLSVIDVASDKVVATIPLGASGFRIAFSPARDKAYITATQRIKLPGEPRKAKDEQMTQLIVVDLQKRQPVCRIPLDLSPMANVHMSLDGQTAYVVTAAAQGSRNEKRGRVLYVDIQSGQITKTINIGLNPLDSVMSADGKRLYTTDWGSTSISVIDLPAGRLEDTFPLGAAPVRSLALSADGKHLYAVQERTFTAPGMVPVNNTYLAQNTQVFNTQTSPAPADDDQLLEIDTTSGEIRRLHIDFLKVVYALALSPDESRLYIYGRTITPANVTTESANATQSQAVRPPADGYDLQVMDLRNRRVVSRYGNFGYLATITLTPDGKKLYLVGTPGEAHLEARVQSRNADGLRDIAFFAPGSVKSNGPRIIKDLSDLPKTVTILDAATGKRLGSTTVGSLPQGAEILKP
ncbi:MAG: YncE family protein [Armatimonadota bacterium]